MGARTINTTAAVNIAAAAPNAATSASRSVDHDTPRSWMGDSRRAMAGIVITSSQITAVAVRDENTATLHAVSDAPMKAAHVPAESETHRFPRLTASSSAA